MSAGSTAPSIESSTVRWTEESVPALCSGPPSTAAELEPCTEALETAGATFDVANGAWSGEASAFELLDWLGVLALYDASFGPEPFGVILVETLAIERTQAHALTRKKKAHARCRTNLGADASASSWMPLVGGADRTAHEICVLGGSATCDELEFASGATFESRISSSALSLTSGQSSSTMRSSSSSMPS
jgi:hypothetical protein